MSGIKETNLGLIALVQGNICTCLKEGICSDEERENSFER